MKYSMIDDAKKKIIKRYLKNVHGKKPDTLSYDPRHDGKGGYWLEKQMGIEPNASNTPDLFEYEMKNHTNNVLTLGSWDPNYWVFRNEKYDISRDSFLDIFGHPNPEKNNRPSWSGKPVPKIDGTNSFGVQIEIDSDSNILFVYSYSDDTRNNKSTVVPKELQVENLTICKWNSSGKKSLREKVESKFNQKGWFKCLQNKDGVYSEIVFGKPFTFETFINYFKNGDIYFDCGMYRGNERNYCQWRTKNSFWDSLITSRHP
jgi:hypothetical protein